MCIGLADLSVTLTDAQRKAAINAPYQSRQDARTLEDWLEIHPQRIVMLGSNADSRNIGMRVTSQFCGPLSRWWLNRKQHASIPNTFDSLVIEIRKMSVMPNVH
jgi:hypothetical protein